jgi:hypothetical protein
MGARWRCVTATLVSKRPRRVASPAASVRSQSSPFWQVVPAYTRSETCVSAGMGSPVSKLVSTLPLPRSTKPSTGMRSPAATRTTALAGTASAGTSRSASPSTR